MKYHRSEGDPPIDMNIPQWLYSTLSEIVIEVDRDRCMAV